MSVPITHSLKVSNQDGARPCIKEYDLCVQTVQRNGKSDDVKVDRFSLKKSRPLAWICDEDAYGTPVTSAYDLESEENGHPFTDLCDISAPQTDSYFETQVEFLNWALDILHHSPLMNAFIHHARQKGWRLKLSHMPDGGYHLDADTHTLIVDHGGLSINAISKSAHLRSALLACIMRGLRDIWHINSLTYEDTDYTAEDVLMVERIRSADADLMAIMGAWELRAHGHTELWRYLLSGDDGDLALVFACAIEKSPASLFDGSALTHTFDQWFADPARVDTADYSALETLDALLATQDNAQSLGIERLKAVDVESLSILPNGISYLKTRGQNILKDPAYAGLNDPINQAHLFQVVYDSKVTVVGGVPFRDQSLAEKLFPTQ